MRSQQVRRLDLRKAEDKPRAALEPSRGLASSLSPEGLACWGVRSLRAHQRAESRREPAGIPQPHPHAGSFCLLLPFILEFGKILFP